VNISPDLVVLPLTLRLSFLLYSDWMYSLLMILVTGAAGFIGSHLVHELVANGQKVRAVDCLLADSYSSELKLQNWKGLQSLGNVDCQIVDLRLPLKGDLLSDIKIIINEAAMPGLVKSWKNFDLYSSCNILSVNNLLEAAVEKDVSHFVQISTSSVYGNVNSGDEYLPLNPISPYGVTKLAAEEIVKMYSRTRGMKYSILRYFSVFGPRQRPDMAYHKFIQSIMNGRTINVYGDGKQIRTNTYVDDCVSATISAALANPSNSEFNISGGEPIELMNAISEIEAQLGMKAKIDFHASHPGDQKNTIDVSGKAKESFGFEPKFSFKEGISRQIDWQRGLTQDYVMDV